VRIALDSSVLIAPHISRAGVCSELQEDEFILEELSRKLSEKFDFP